MVEVLGAVEVKGRALRVLAAQIGVLGLVIVPAVVAVEAKVGPVVVVFWMGRGVYALDAVLMY